MLFDIAYKLARKSMPTGLYDAISYDLLGRRSNYEKKGTYEAIFRHYLDQGVDFRGKTVVEAGSGLQYFTSLYFLSAGAAEVSLVEPKLAFDADVLRKTVEAFNRGADKPLAFEDVRSRIFCYRDLRQIPEVSRESADLLVSYTVLEHVADLGSFFSESARVLKPGALAYHLVDLSDHTYQVFARWRPPPLSTRPGPCTICATPRACSGC
jgi:SAM-dependent methyltransferase